LDLFNKEKEEQEIESKSFDPESGIEINDKDFNYNFSKLRKKSRKAKAFTETHETFSNHKTIECIEQGEIPEEANFPLMEEDICEDIMSLEEIQGIFKEYLD
jgi:hypothetical protein